MQKLKIINFRDQSANHMILVTFDKSELFLENYKGILKEIGMEIKSERNPFYKENLDEGISFGSNQKFDVEIIYLSTFIALVVRYRDEESKNEFMRVLYKYAG